tara:strand:+ start:276 stop:1241 length:966 start_codon:yes stop_codon:yes gene_type:complete
MKMEEVSLPKKKRGRKAKVKTEDEQTQTQTQTVEPKTPKKRGRKPKGGKIIQVTSPQEGVKVPEPNIILHLKCSISDLGNNNFISSIKYDPEVEHVETFQFEQTKKGHDLNMHIIKKDIPNEPNEVSEEEESKTCGDTKSIWKKLRKLAVNLHTNNISDKRSACFWCTCDFDNPPIYIPKLELNGSYQCYGCFCSPECAAAYLFSEHVDSAIQFERYHMLNHLYCKIYDYEKNIKPAPNPYYTLDKFYGNLSIQEYRRLLQNERLLLVVDKPLVRILPELHEDNDDFVFNNKTIPSANKFNVKKRTALSKKEIMNENFNFK